MSADRFRIESARLIMGLVGIWCFSVEAMVFFHIVKGVRHQSAIASIIAVPIAAIDQILFGQRNQLVGFDKCLTLKSTGRGECPAWAALALIFDRCHSSFCAPIDFCWVIGVRWHKFYSLCRFIAESAISREQINDKSVNNSLCWSYRDFFKPFRWLRNSWWQILAKSFSFIWYDTNFCKYFALWLMTNATFSWKHLSKFSDSKDNDCFM